MDSFWVRWQQVHTYNWYKGRFVWVPPVWWLWIVKISLSSTFHFSSKRLGIGAFQYAFLVCAQLLAMTKSGDKNSRLMMRLIISFTCNGWPFSSFCSAGEKTYDNILAKLNHTQFICIWKWRSFLPFWFPLNNNSPLGWIPQIGYALHLMIWIGTNLY